MRKKGPLLVVTPLFCLLWIASTPSSHSGARYVDNGDGTITDQETNLIGIKNAGCFGKKSWDAALSAVRTLSDGSCGLSDGSLTGDWHLPTKTTLPTLFAWSESGLFSGGQAHFYWSSTAYTDVPKPQPWAWVIYLGNGYVGKDNASNGNYVWPVRTKKR